MPTRVYAEIDGQARSLDFAYDADRREITADLGSICAGERVCVHVESDGVLPENEVEKTAFRLLADAQCDHGLKEALYGILRSNKPLTERVVALLRRAHPLACALVELLTAKEE